MGMIFRANARPIPFLSPQTHQAMHSLTNRGWHSWLDCHLVWIEITTETPDTGTNEACKRNLLKGLTY